MPITPYLDDFDVNAETKRVLSAALEETRISLGLGDNFADGLIAGVCCGGVGRFGSP